MFCFFLLLIKPDEFRAKIDARDSNGLFPFQVAVLTNNHSAIAKYLVEEQNADVFVLKEQETMYARELHLLTKRITNPLTHMDAEGISSKTNKKKQEHNLQKNKIDIKKNVFIKEKHVLDFLFSFSYFHFRL